MGAEKISKKRSLLELVTLVGLRGGISLSQAIVVFVAGTLLDFENFGRFSIIYAGMRILASLAGFGAASFVLRDIPARLELGKPGHRAGNVLLNFVFFPALTCLAVAGILEALATTESSYYPLLQGEGAALAATAFVWGQAQLFGAYIRATRTSMEAMFTSDLFPPIALLISLLAFWFAGEADVIKIYAGCIALILAGVAILICLHFLFRWIPLSAQGQPFGVKDSVPYWGAVSLNTASSQLDIVLTGVLLGPTSAGIYALLKRAANLVAIPQSIAVWIFAPRVSRASAVKDTVKIMNAAKSSTKLSFLPGLLLAAFIGISSFYWFAHFELEANQSNFLLLALCLAAQLTSIGFGLSHMFATQTGMPSVAVKAISRAILIAAATMFILTQFVGVFGIVIGQIVMFIFVNYPTRKAMLSKYNVDISATNLIRRNRKIDQN